MCQLVLNAKNSHLVHGGPLSETHTHYLTPA